MTPVLLRCTRGFLKLLGNCAGTLVEAEAGIDDWYANLFVIERRKCLLLVHADTLFSVLDTDVRVAQLDDLGLYVATLVVDALASEGLPVTTLGPVDPSGVLVARTASRSVLGHMNAMTLETQQLIAQEERPTPHLSGHPRRSTLAQRRLPTRADHAQEIARQPALPPVPSKAESDSVLIGSARTSTGSSTRLGAGYRQTSVGPRLPPSAPWVGETLTVRRAGRIRSC